MKTITDAVNEFKGELRGGVSHVIRNNVGTIAYWYDDVPITLLGQCWHIVCADAEFYAHVKELTGCPVKLKQWQDSKMNKTIKDAYEDLKGDLGNSRKPLSSDKFVYFDKDIDDYMCFHDKAKCKRKYQYICTVEEFINYGKSVEVKQVYTKAMQDAGELPSIGELVQIGKKDGGYTDFFNGKLVHVECNKLWISDDKHGDRIVNFGDVIFQPIDTRTDKEKAIDDIHEEMYRRMELKRSDDDCLCSDDTQVGVEFLIEYMDLNFPNWAGK